MFHFPGKVPVIFKRFYKINSAKFIERYPAEVIHPGIFIIADYTIDINLIFHFPSLLRRG